MPCGASFGFFLTLEIPAFFPVYPFACASTGGYLPKIHATRPLLEAIG
jgi:hypothetical protein